MDWTNELIIKFIHLYRSYEHLWDAKNESHRNRHKVNAAWSEILERLEVPFTVQELKRKKESLLAAYRNCKAKRWKSEQLGDSPLYQPSWFAYEILDSFLGAHYEATHQYYEALDKSEQEIVNEEETNSGDSWRDPLIMEDDSRQQHEKNNFSSALPTITKKRQTVTKSIRPKASKMISIESSSKAFDNSRTDDEDECDLYGKLLVRKLRRLPHECRDLVMLKIDELVYETSINYQSNDFISIPSSSSGRKWSSIRNSSKRLKKIPKINQIRIESPSSVSMNAKIEEDNNSEDDDDDDENILTYED